jgi:copper chaperone CopZ
LTFQLAGSRRLFVEGAAQAANPQHRTGSFEAMSHTLDFKVIGEETIHCQACEQRIGTILRRLPGVEDVKASSQTQQVHVTIDPARVGSEQVKAKLVQIGYQVTPEESPG